MLKPLHEKPIDLNVPPDADPKLWLDRTEAECLAYDPEARMVPRAGNKTQMVRMTPAMQSLVRNLRKQAGMTGDQAAYAVGRSQSWIAHMENGTIAAVDEDYFDALLLMYNTRIQGASPNGRVAVHPPGR